MITNSDLEMAALVLHEDTLRTAVPDVRLDTPHSGSDNNLTIFWSTKEASMINPMVAYLLCIRVIHSTQLFINPSVFITQASKIAWQMTPLDFWDF